MNICYRIKDLEDLFAQTFYQQYRTRLVSGFQEPLYQPAVNKECDHQIQSTQDYFASGLHEIAHWCLAGEERREQLDYGYWYIPDGRDVAQQIAFEIAEVKPQAIEKAFSLACDHPFKVSNDNLNARLTTVDDFTVRVEQQYLTYEHYGYPKRAAQFIQRLKEFYENNSARVNY